MIVEQIGYIKTDNISNMLTNGEKFCLYKTHKNTCILIKDTDEINVYLYYPKKDRLPWKIIEGKKIIHGERIFSSDNKDNVLDNSLWNNCNQVMVYKPI
jgi:hypothetical protein